MNPQHMMIAGGAVLGGILLMRMMGSRSSSGTTANPPALVPAVDVPLQSYGNGFDLSGGGNITPNPYPVPNPIGSSSPSNPPATTPPKATSAATATLPALGIPNANFTSPIPLTAVASPNSQGYNVQTGQMQGYTMQGGGTTQGGLVLGPASSYTPPPGGWGASPYIVEGGQLVTRDASGF